MLAFAGNSVLCRMALQHSSIDAASFTAIRLVSGAAVLYALTRIFGKARQGTGSWASALALFVYAAAFSFAYTQLSTGTGALLLFGAVQVSMISLAWFKGDRPQGWQWLGLLLAFAGLVVLVLPGLSAPPVLGSALMLSAGVAWGVYSVRAKGAGDPTRVTGGNFARAAVMGLVLAALFVTQQHIEAQGAAYAVASGAVTSGLGYAIWYRVVPVLRASSAAVVQLSVPLIAALGGIVFVGESPSLRFVLASMATLGGIALVMGSKPRS
jgi:drug/metabolite transporter (DMT)-like permease